MTELTNDRGRPHLQVGPARGPPSTGHWPLTTEQKGPSPVARMTALGPSTHWFGSRLSAPPPAFLHHPGASVGEVVRAPLIGHTDTTGRMTIAWPLPVRPPAVTASLAIETS